MYLSPWLLLIIDVYVSRYTPAGNTSLWQKRETSLTSLSMSIPRYDPTASSEVNGTKKCWVSFPDDLALLLALLCSPFSIQVEQSVPTALWISTVTGACWPAWGTRPTTCWRCGIGCRRRWCSAARPFLRRSTEWPSPHTTPSCSRRQDLDISSKAHPQSSF